MTKAELLGWRQRGFIHGRFNRGKGVEHARETGGAEAVRAFVQGKRAGERERQLGQIEPAGVGR